MTYLLDAHYVIGAITDSDQIPNHSKILLIGTGIEIVVSSVSLWEISLKFYIGKIKIEGMLPHEIPIECESMDFKIIELTAVESSTYNQLKANHHNDPFDRMLIWQAIQNNFTLITADSYVARYKTAGLKVIT